MTPQGKQPSGRETVVITGASDGIGAAAARQLATSGRQVVVVGRNPERTRAVAQSIGAPFHLADFADLSQVRRLAAELTEAYPRIDVLANNAGGVFDNQPLTGDGFEITFQVNHLAGFLLTNLLLPTLLASDATVIQTASMAARAGSIDLETLPTGGGSFGKVYSNTKLANILFTRELHRRFHDQGLSSAAFHPGVVGSSFSGNLSGVKRFFYQNPLSKLLFTTSEVGGQRLAFLVEGVPGENWVSGSYYEKSLPATTNRQADDVDLATALWDRSAALVGL